MAKKQQVSDTESDSSPKKVKKTPAKKGAAKKDKEGPKRPTTAFFFYSQDKRPELFQDRPELKSKAAETSKVIGEMWRGLTDKEKEPFMQKAAKDKERYEREKRELGL